MLKTKKEIEMENSQNRLKFRAWDGKEMLIEVYVRDGFVYVIPERVYNTPHIELERVDNAIPLQYTGFRDKNGKGEELYHKDLIINHSRNYREPHVIEWSDKKGAWVGVYGGLEYLIAEELYEIGKVGNFYENPELIK